MADDKTAASSGAPVSSGKNPFVTILLILNMAAMGTIAFFQYKFMEMEAKRPDLTALLKEQNTAAVDPEAAGEQAATEQTAKTDQLLVLEPFTVNLAQGDGPRRYVRLDAVLRLSNDTKLDEIEARKPQIRDSIISILNTKRPDDLLKKEGKTYLKEEIKASINSFLVDGRIEDVFYTSFQIN
ncbi:MAG: flagellar basal body-associated FliL family protein [Bacteriovoracaceae bacterium]